MPLYLEYTKHYNAVIARDKQLEILARTKRDIKNDLDDLSRKEHADAKAQGKASASFVVNATITDGGIVKHYYNDEKFGTTGYADAESVYVVAMYKRLIPLLAANISRMGIVKKVITALGLMFSMRVLPEWFELIFGLKKVLLKDEYWCPVTKEIRRALQGKMDDRLIDALSGIIEYDSAYRYPLIDVLMLLDKEAFKKNWRKEFNKLLGVATSRIGADDAVKFVNIAKLLPIYLFFNRKLLKNIKAFVEELDLKKIQPDEDDVYWMLFLETYNCFGLSKEERKQKRDKLNMVRTK